MPSCDGRHAQPPSPYGLRGRRHHVRPAGGGQDDGSHGNGEMAVNVHSPEGLLLEVWNENSMIDDLIGSCVLALPFDSQER